jgi:predicted O-linked N-acetylglucosamine transferase (SPINDLY family)
LGKKVRAPFHGAFFLNLMGWEKLMQPEAQAALRRVWLKQELTRYRQRSEVQPDHIDAWRQVGRICWELGETEQALEALEKALILQPDDGESLLGYMVVCLTLNRNEDALETSTRMLKLFPHHPQALLHQFEALLRLGRLTEASATGECVIALGLGNLDFRLSQARLLCQLDRPAEALELVEAMIAAPEMQLTAQCLKARILAMLWRFDEADVLLGQLQDQYPHAALEQEFEPWRLPDEVPEDSLRKYYTGRGLLMAHAFEAQKECNWTHWEKILAHLDDLLQDALRYGFVAGLEAHRLLSLPIHPALQLAVVRAQAAAVDTLMAPIRQQLPIQWMSRQPSQRLRVGYVSGDFRNHATAHLIRKLFQVHDRERFEIFGYSLLPSDGSDYWRDISQACDQFVELYGVSNADAATRIAADGIQILVDLHGYTRFARPEIFALRPAPVQIAFLGYPGTLGADYIPYIIADPVVLPDKLRPYFSEQPVYLDCYQVNDDEQPIASTGLTRMAAGLPEGGFVYCCFNTPYKIDPGVFGVWMRILRQTPGSVLWLLAGTPRSIDHLRTAAQKQGVAPERLIFAPRLPKAEHLERHRLADVFLDTFIVNAHTSASDALWAGLPVLTRPGVNFQSRVCASLLVALGLQEWIVNNDDEYENRAVELAHDGNRLQEWRVRLAEHCTTYPLFATERFARQIEQSFLVIWQQSSLGFSV